jgi:hypothetical protein
MGSGKATIHNIELSAEGGETKSLEGLSKFNYRDTVFLEIDFSVLPEVERCNVVVQFSTRGMTGAGQCLSIDNGLEVINNAERLKVKVTLRDLPLSPGKYNFTVIIFDKENSERLAINFAAQEFYISGESVGKWPVQLKGNWERL